MDLTNNISDTSPEKSVKRKRDELSSTNKAKKGAVEFLLYDEEDKGPFLVYIDLKNEPQNGGDQQDAGKRKPINQMRLGSILNKLQAKNVISIIKIGFKRCKVIFGDYRAANMIVKHPGLEEHNLVARILPSFTMKFGLIFGVPTEYTEEELISMADPISQAKTIERIYRKDKASGELFPTMRIKVGFKSNFVPEEVKFGYAIMQCKYYVPQIRQCFRCQRFGHMAGNCKQSLQICVNCGGPHSAEDCKACYKACANCGGNHPANDRACVMRDRYYKIHKMMVLENLNYKEAEKKLVIPDFRYLQDDFPALPNSSGPVVATTQQRVNAVMTSSFPYSSLAHAKRKTPKKTVSNPYVAPTLGVNTYGGYEGGQPIYELPEYIKNKVSEYERTLTEMADLLENTVAGNLNQENNIAIANVVGVARNLIEKDETNMTELSGNISSLPSSC